MPVCKLDDLQNQTAVNGNVRLPLVAQQLRQGVEVVLVWAVEIPQLPGGIVPLPSHHEPLFFGVGSAPPWATFVVIVIIVGRVLAWVACNQ